MMCMSVEVRGGGQKVVLSYLMGALGNELRPPERKCVLLTCGPSLQATVNVSVLG